MSNNNNIWTDWLIKHKNNQENMRINENYSDIEELMHSIEILLDDMVGSREIRPNKKSVTGLIKPNPEHPQIPFESSLERDFVLLMAGRPGVLSIESQPITIRYLNEFGKERSYTPDFLVTYKDFKSETVGKRILIVEVKYQEDLAADKTSLLQKFHAASLWCEFKDWQFSVYTETEIRTKELDRSRFLLSHRFHKQNVRAETHILGVLQNLGKRVTIRDILRKKSADVSEQGIYQEILRLLAINFLVSDFEKPINDDTLIWLWYDE